MNHTGLPSKHIFESLLKLMDSFEIQYYLHWQVIRYTTEDQLLMTLMKLRMNLRNFDLAQRFNCSETTVTNITHTWIIALPEILVQQHMRKMPSKEKNMLCLPASFSMFPNCRVVIDCTEIKCDNPSKMDLQKKIYSSYKHMPTAKRLVGVAPNGDFC